MGSLWNSKTGRENCLKIREILSIDGAAPNHRWAAPYHSCFNSSSISGKLYCQSLWCTDRSRKKLKEGSLDEFKCWLGSNNPSNVEGYLNDPFYLWFMGTRCGHILDIIFLSPLPVASLTRVKMNKTILFTVVSFLYNQKEHLVDIIILLILLNDRKNSCYDRVG